MNTTQQLRSTPFVSRHIGTLDPQAQAAMLQALQVPSLSALIAETVPANIRLPRELNLPAAVTEDEFLAEFKALMSKNKLYRSHIGMGYYGTFTPSVILRNILENPGWYTAYTPYQAEIAQGRMEALLNFQTMVMDLTGMQIANASLLDEGTAAAEAMAMLHGQRKAAKKEAHTLFVDERVHPQTIDVLKTRATPIQINLEVGPLSALDLTRADLYAIVLQYPDTTGGVEDYTDFIAAAHEHNVFVCVATDLLALTVLKSPGEMGADVAFGSSQRFGIPMGFGGPHAAFFATHDEFKRHMPGRIIGVSQDAQGKPALRMALQTREQHIRREKATSNICTAQVLLSVMAGSYAVYHGPDGLRQIAERTHTLTRVLASGAASLGYSLANGSYFDSITLITGDAAKVATVAAVKQINLRVNNGSVGISLDETTTLAHVQDLLDVLATVAGKSAPLAQEVLNSLGDGPAYSNLKRTSDYMTHPVFHSYHSEHEMLRYLKRLENKDLSMVHSMISLGSCTMKLNATTEMIPVTWPEVGGLHPFAPESQWQGYKELFANLEMWLAEVTGFAAVSLQPNSGAQGEYAGLMVIRAYHQSRGDHHRNIALIPSSAHGTNPASAVMAGMQVVVVKCDERGNVDIDDLRAKAEAHSSNLAALMVTYPSTHGVFEEGISEICNIIHSHGGQVYMDGANMNAQVGLTSPGFIGADVCHLNLHKTFCIPHGGGGPGMGPIGVAAHLAPFLPGHPEVTTGGDQAITAISAAPFGSASILSISYAYIRMMGPDGLRMATEYAILNANYIKQRLEGAFSILYSGANGRCAHEMIVDFRAFKSLGVEVEDVAKRLMDYGYHAPTVSFPVAGTIMIEPTESETKEELDRFCDALLSIRAEIEEIATGAADAKINVLKMAPHTAELVTSDEWDRPYTRKKAAYPLPYIAAAKFWPSVSRVDNAYGDRNLICSCLPIDSYAEVEA